ncbi:hypothetical protein [Holdemanella biformis]|uniref:hypothetical protein n=1 Tax=Holdemanella biformis TaxID=1735 RepID=UPI0024912F29|nr:hypothetical protein [Holdemanella biformis]
MKFKTTQKEIKAGYAKVISVGYCSLQTLLQYETPVAYTSGREGWKADIYAFDNVAIVTGYAPFGKYHAEYKLCEQYEGKAQVVIEAYRHNYDYQETKCLLNNLIKQFIYEVTK